MRIGYDHATIAHATLDNKENTASDRGRLLRATARLYDSKAVYGSRTDSRPKPDALRNPPGEGRVMEHHNQKSSVAARIPLRH